MKKKTIELTEKFDKRIELYKENFQQYGYSEKSLEMPSDRRNIRYYELIKNFDFFKKRDGRAFSLLDAGCGFGDINAYLKMQKIENYKYFGIDMVDEFIQVAIEKYGDNDDISFFKKNMFLDALSEFEYDYAISSQTFNDPYTSEIDNNYNVIYSTVEKLFLNCKKGVSFNFVTNRGDVLKEGIAYHDPVKIMDFAYSLSKNVIMDNSCLPYECTCTIIKDEIVMNGKVFKSFMDLHEEELSKEIFVIKGI